MKTKLLVVAALAVALSGCSSVSTGPDEQAAHYKGGATQSKKFEKCIKPSTREYDGPGDSHFVYPAGQRTYSFTGRKGSEADAISVKTNDSQEMTVKGFVTFELTEDCKLLRKFHEQIGSKYEAYEAAGWSEFLGDYMGVPLNSTMDKAALSFDWRTLYSSNEALGKFETYVTENLPTEVKSAMGEGYITVKTVSLETPQPTKNLREGLESKEKAKLENDAQKEQNQKLRTQYDSFRDCKKVLSEASCVTLRLAENGDIKIYPIPQGSGIIANG